MEPGRGVWGSTEDFRGLAFNKSTEGPQKMPGCVFSKQIDGHLFNKIPIKWSRKLLQRLDWQGGPRRHLEGLIIPPSYAAFLLAHWPRDGFHS